MTTETEETKPFPILYILMRTDLDSMNTGKGMAQASHAASAFTYNGSESLTLSHTHKDLYKLWSHQTDQNFGTVLVLDLQIGSELDYYVEQAEELDLPTEVIHDPTYPVQDGDVTHYIPMDTCAYIFGDKNNESLTELLSELSLHY